MMGSTSVSIIAVLWNIPDGRPIAELALEKLKLSRYEDGSWDGSFPRTAYILAELRRTGIDEDWLGPSKDWLEPAQPLLALGWIHLPNKMGCG